MGAPRGPSCTSLPGLAHLSANWTSSISVKASKTRLRKNFESVRSLVLDRRPSSSTGGWGDRLQLNFHVESFVLFDHRAILQDALADALQVGRFGFDDQHPHGQVEDLEPAVTIAGCVLYTDEWARNGRGNRRDQQS